MVRRGAHQRGAHPTALQRHQHPRALRQSFRSVFRQVFRRIDEEFVFSSDRTRRPHRYGARRFHSACRHLLSALTFLAASSKLPSGETSAATTPLSRSHIGSVDSSFSPRTLDAHSNAASSSWNSAGFPGGVRPSRDRRAPRRIAARAHGPASLLSRPRGSSGDWSPSSVNVLPVEVEGCGSLRRHLDHRAVQVAEWTRGDHPRARPPVAVRASPSFPCAEHQLDERAVPRASARFFVRRRPPDDAFRVGVAARGRHEERHVDVIDARSTDISRQPALGGGRDVGLSQRPLLRARQTGVRRRFGWR